MKKNVYTIELWNKTKDEIYEYCAAYILFYNLKKCCVYANKIAKLHKDLDNEIIVRVYAGEYETKQGIFGEPLCIFETSNKKQNYDYPTNVLVQLP